MRATYVFRYFNAQGCMIRMCMKQCDDERDALRIAVADCGECQRIQISTSGRIIWSGSLDEAAAA